MNVLTEMSMPLYRREYKRLVSGEDCQVVAKEAIKGLLERTMDVALQERMGRGVQSERAGKDRRNGYYERDLLTSWGWINRIRVPRGRVTSIADVVLPKYHRRQPEFDAAVMSSFLFGHSTRKCRRFFTELFGEMGVSHSTVSRILEDLDARCQRWRERALDKPYAYVWLDGKCAAIAGARKHPYSTLWAYGATEEGERELLGFETHRSEGTANWESLFLGLLKRGLDPEKLKLVIRDENSGCEQAVLSLLGAVAQQSCAIHLQRNVGKLASKANRGAFQERVGEIFKQESLRQGRSRLQQVLNDWQEREPQACLYLRKNVDKSLVFYGLATSATWRTHLKSTNMLERFFRELKRYEKSRQCRFATTRSCERFYYAFAKDYNDRYPTMPVPRPKPAEPRVPAKRSSEDSHHGIFSGGVVSGHPEKTASRNSRRLTPGNSR
jgi:putative transposase